MLYYISQNIIWKHYSDVILGAMASQITSLTIVYSTLHSGTDQTSKLTGLCAGNSPVTGYAEMFPFMTSSWCYCVVVFCIFTGLYHFHDDVIKRKHFSRHWPFVWGIRQWRRTLVFSLICAWTNGWVNNRLFETPSRSLWCHCTEDNYPGILLCSQDSTLHLKTG